MIAGKRKNANTFEKLLFIAAFLFCGRETNFGIDLFKIRFNICLSVSFICSLNMMKIELIENLKGGEFVVQESGNRRAEMSYTNAGDDKIIIAHTFVEEIFRGENIGKDLVKAGVDFARERKLKIVPLCPFAKSEFEKNSDYADVWFE